MNGSSEEKNEAGSLIGSWEVGFQYRFQKIVQSLDIPRRDMFAWHSRDFDGRSFTIISASLRIVTSTLDLDQSSLKSVKVGDGGETLLHAFIVIQMELGMGCCDDG